jgi:5-methylcytosine-specific restriction enzyme A
MIREKTRWIEKRHVVEGSVSRPLCLVPTCNTIAERYKNGNYKNYCDKHTFRNMKRFTSWTVLRKVCFERDGYTCVKCGDGRKKIAIKRIPRWDDAEHTFRISNLQADHITEVANGGAMWDLDNLQTLCVKCHQEKTSQFNSIKNKMKNNSIGPEIL